jgi:hypothetical protein
MSNFSPNSRPRKSLPEATLQPRDKIKAAYFHESRGICQQVLAEFLEVSIECINDAINEMRQAVGLEAVGTED